MAERTVAFDAMGTLFDLAPVRERYGEAAMPTLLHRAAALQLAGRFVPFPELVAATLGEEALDLFARLDPFPDAAPALDALAAAGIRSVVLTNGSAENTRTLLERGGLAARVAEAISVERVRRYKPAPEPYRLLGERAVLVAAHDWDVAGALAAGLRAVLVDRDGNGWRLPGPEPGRAPDLVAAAEAAAA